MKVDNIINEWDPYSLFPLAPKDEYRDEIKKIKIYIDNDKDIDSLAKYLGNIFDVDMIFDEKKLDFLTIAKKLVI